MITYDADPVMVNGGLQAHKLRDENIGVECFVCHAKIPDSEIVNVRLIEYPIDYDFGRFCMSCARKIFNFPEG